MIDYAANDRRWIGIYPDHWSFRIVHKGSKLLYSSWATVSYIMSTIGDLNKNAYDNYEIEFEAHNGSNYLPTVSIEEFIMLVGL
jgi:hypothetical protein